jgi:hypothetical protein
MRALRTKGQTLEAAVRISKMPRSHLSSGKGKPDFHLRTFNVIFQSREDKLASFFPLQRKIYLHM